MLTKFNACIVLWSVAKPEKGKGCSPLLTCRTKRRIRKIPRFNTTETVFSTKIDSKNDLKHILKSLFRRAGAINLSKIKLLNQRKNFET